MTVMMSCGHAANARNSAGQPSCVICIGIDPGAEIPAPAPDLTGRMSRCSYCGREVPSSTDLAFFEHVPYLDYDRHYCGCRGWD